jgi:hypothetical protein
MLGKKSPMFFVVVSVFLMYSACGSMGPSGGSAAVEPGWVADPYARYSSREYIAAVGTGRSRQEAERAALTNLISIFGQSIQVDQTISTSYQEVVRSGAAASWSESMSSDTNIALSTGMDTLVGAEIGEAWADPRGTHYAAAILNKQKAAQTYTNMVRENMAMIERLTNMPATEKNTLGGYSRYQFAGTLADINTAYGNLLQQIGAPYQGIKMGNDYRLEAAAIAQTIPVRVAVSKGNNVDPGNRINGAFAKALADAGFPSGGANSRYVLDVSITSSVVEIANNQNKFSRIEVTANLTDTATQAVLVPFSFNSREGHTSQAEADNRAVLTAERKINSDYAKELKDYLSGLLPGR